MNFNGCTIYLFNVNVLNTLLGNCRAKTKEIKDSVKPKRDTNQDKKHWQRLLLF